MTPERILIIQLRRVGDVILTLPVLGVLRRKFPHAKIDFLVEKPSDQMVRLNPHASEVLVYDPNRALDWIRQIRARRYDWVIDFHSNGRTVMLTLFSGAPLRAGFEGPLTRKIAYNRRARNDDRLYLVDQKMQILESLGIPADRWTWDIEVPAAERNWARAHLADLGRDPSRKLIGIAPASRRATRRWAPERFAALARRFAESGRDVLLLWGPGEKELMDLIAREGNPGASNAGRLIIPKETPLLELAALIRECALVVALDNGPKNMAVALSVPTVSILGPTNPLSFNPHDDPMHPVVRDEALACIGCGKNLCPTQHECMDHVTVDRVWEESQKVLRLAPRAAKQAV